MSISVVGGRHADQGAGTDPAVAAVLTAVEGAQRRQLSWAQSPDAPAGEHIVRSSVRIAARYGWTALHDVPWATSEPGIVLHVAVGPGGVVVIDERLWEGPVRIDGDVLRHQGFRCDGELAVLAGAVATVAARVPAEHRDAVSGVVCVTPRDLPPHPVAGATVVGRLHLATLLTSLEPRLSPLDVARVVLALSPTVAPAVAVAPAQAQPAPALVQTPARPAPAGAPQPAPPEERPRDRAAYFASRPMQSSSWSRPSASVPGGGSRARGQWRTAAGRVTIAVAVGLATYGGSDAITSAVGEWMGTPTTVQAAAW